MSNDEKLVKVERKVGDVLYHLVLLCAVSWPAYTLM